jgi:hypothetical protein
LGLPYPRDRLSNSAAARVRGCNTCPVSRGPWPPHYGGPRRPAAARGGPRRPAAARGDRVAFEIDHIDEVWEEGWSLLAFGHLREVEDPAELARVRQLPLRPWASGDKPYYLRLEILSLSGRRTAYLG